ncbi:TonB C-terminal domain-containing protein [Bradyrhizobium cenepequi]|uniref:TonB C-terminal domain-containing protein n=1 Tax=Bradyrhizobium cenepequi TaxID=2821403 RepID=UPI001CE25C81|nr:hypothetical protein [Bradyrhizobium cenepequi]MCA6107366.1 hypothetical protein [Bradyrhizobium cenepequi]
MQDVQTFQRYAALEDWRERWSAVATIVVALLLALSLFALIWMALHSPEPARREPTIIQLLFVPPTPPQRPPEPAKETVQRTLQAPPPVPVPPKKVVNNRRDSVAAAPIPKPGPPQPKTKLPAVADPLSLDAPPDWRQASLPKGANAGNTIGGDGENGGGSGCGSAGPYLTIITSQLRNVVTRNERTDSRRYQAQAQLWFDELGNVQRSQLVRSTGTADIDATVTKLLKGINIGRGMPQCVQPITVWISQPWTGVFNGADNNPVTPSHVEVWRTFRRP